MTTLLIADAGCGKTGQIRNQLRNPRAFLLSQVPLYGLVFPCSCETTVLLDLNHSGRGGRRGKIPYVFSLVC